MGIKFYHEEIIEIEEKHRKEMMSFVNRKEIYDMFYDIAAEWTSMDRMVSIDGMYPFPEITLYRNEDTTPYDVEEFMEYIEEHFIIDYKVSTVPYLSSMISYYYCSATKPGFKICVYNSHCKKIKTGRLIEEEITICNHEGGDSM